MYELLAIIAPAKSVGVGAGSAGAGCNGGRSWQARAHASRKEDHRNAIAPSIRDAATAQYRWPKIQNAPDGPIDYCGTVNAKSPYTAYTGRQAFIVSATLAGGKVSSAVVELIAGGKDFEIVRNMCKKNNLDPEAN